MAEICSCKTGIINFGQPNCIDSFVRDARLIFVNYLDDTGAVNSIKSTDTLDSTFFDDKFNNADLDKRWYITPTINNVVGVREENVTEDVDNINFSVKQGNRMYDGTFYGNVAAPPFIEALQSTACQQMGFFIVDVAGNIIGMNNDLSTDLDPIRIQRNTTQVLYLFSSATTVQNINLKFMYEENERDADLSFIGSGNIEVDLLTQVAMTTIVLGEATNITTSGFTSEIDFIYGEQFDKLPYEGAVVDDFVLTEISPSPGPIVLTSVTETSPGVYDFVTPMATSADTFELSYSKTTGAGFESIVNLAFLIP